MWYRIQLTAIQGVTQCGPVSLMVFIIVVESVLHQWIESVYDQETSYLGIDCVMVNKGMCLYTDGEIINVNDRIQIQVIFLET